MSFPFFIAKRYLTARSKRTFISIISLMSVMGVAIGVAALVILHKVCAALFLVALIVLLSIKAFSKKKA